jgi:hypothetical protein
MKTFSGACRAERPAKARRRATVMEMIFVRMGGLFGGTMLHLAP